MFNVYYRDDHLQGRMSGPKKVIENLIRSLEETDTPFALNQEKYKDSLFLHWDTYHIEKYHKLKNRDSPYRSTDLAHSAPDFADLKEYGKIIVPCDWVKTLFEKHFNARTLTWPVAVFCPDITDDQSVDFLIYNKNGRSEQEHQALKILSHLKDILLSN